MGAADSRSPREPHYGMPGEESGAASGERKGGEHPARGHSPGIGLDARESGALGGEAPAGGHAAGGGSAAVARGTRVSNRAPGGAKGIAAMMKVLICGVL